MIASDEMIVPQDGQGTSDSSVDSGCATAVGAGLATGTGVGIGLVGLGWTGAGFGCTAWGRTAADEAAVGVAADRGADIAGVACGAGALFTACSWARTCFSRSRRRGGA